MNCEILETLYVRSNGDIPCNDDAGEEVLLGRVDLDDPAWSIEQVLGGAPFAEIRNKLSAGEAPWSQCQRCAWLRPHEPTADALAARKITKLQLEPSLRCNLKCPGCSNQAQSATRHRPHVMPISMYLCLLDSLRNQSYSVDQIEYCGQGEPLLHPKFSSFISLARGHLPSAIQRVITNGNVDYAKATGRQGMEEIFVSCDGLYQANYERYRVGGNVDRAIQFMRDVPKIENGIRQHLIWKYILFEFNDSIAEIEAAQRLAQELGVDTMLFVGTHSTYRSEYWLNGRTHEFPILYPNVATSVTPVQQREIVSST